MKKAFILSSLVLASFCAEAQLSPAITSWLQNTTVTGRHYTSGNSTPINDATLVNV